MDNSMVTSNRPHEGTTIFILLHQVQLYPLENFWICIDIRDCCFHCYPGGSTNNRIESENCTNVHTSRSLAIHTTIKENPNQTYKWKNNHQALSSCINQQSCFTFWFTYKKPMNIQLRNSIKQLMSKPQSITKTHTAQKTNITNNHKSTKKTKNKKSWKTNRRKTHLQVSASETMEQERESMKKKLQVN